MRQHIWSSVLAGRSTRPVILLTLLTLAILLPVWWGAEHWYRERLLEDRRGQVAAQLVGVESSLSAGINRRLARLEGLTAFAQAQLGTEDGISNVEFELFAAGSLADAAGIRGLVLAPGGTPRYVYPPDPSAIATQDLRGDRTELEADAQRAIESRRVEVSGPSEYSPGGLGLVAQQAVFQGDQVWGLAMMTVDLAPVLDDAGLDEPFRGLDIAVRDATGRVFLGSPVVFQADPVMLPIVLPDERWELVAVPADGWLAAVREPLLVYEGAGLVIVFLLTGLAYVIAGRQALLQSAVAERTRELSLVNEELQEDIAERRRVEAKLLRSEELLEQRVVERTRELTALLEVSRSVGSTLELEPLLGLILDELRHVVDYDGAVLLALEDEDLVVLDYRGPVPRDEVLNVRVPLAESDENQAVIRQGAAVIVPDMHGDSAVARAIQLRRGSELDAHAHVRSWLGVPLIVQDRLLGMLHMTHRRPGYYTQEHADLAQAFGQQAAVAMENAHLYAQAQELATMAERARLARELHDSVSQALYGIALGARTARTLAERDPSRLSEPLDYVLSLAEAGLAELRALIYELRPESLEHEGLVAALERQAAALRARHELQVTLDLCDEPEVALPIKEALYRIAQEAMQNAVKHARATSIRVHLGCTDEQLVLGVDDDGIGFDPLGSFPGHLGLQTMRERAERVGGLLQLDSTPRGGTRVLLSVPRGLTLNRPDRRPNRRPRLVAARATVGKP